MDYDSPAAKIFLGNCRKNNINKRIADENRAFKELIIFLMNYKENDKYLDFLKSIQILEIDPAIIPEYIYNLCRGNVSKSLITK